MHILCTICSDLVNQAESLYVTKCGHVFHHQCLAQWIERSKSCPQCRNKVTERCMFRVYPTVSNETSGDDAATLQSRLDDAMLQLRTQRAGHTELQDKLAALTQDLNKKEELLRAAEKRLASRESAVAALSEQLEYVSLQSKEAQRLRDENDKLTKNLQTLNGLQKVLNATAGEVEDTLRGYSDIRTLATFAAALKRALCESEARRRSGRELQRGAEQRLAAERARRDDLRAQLEQTQEKLSAAESQLVALTQKRKAGAGAEPEPRAKHPRSAPEPPAPDAPPEPATPGLNDAIVTENDASFGSAVSRIVAAESPYLSLQRSGLALAALQRRPDHRPQNLKPSEFALLSAAPTSIFRRAPAPSPSPAPSPAPAPALDTAFSEGGYDGLGGHARPDPSPSPRPRPRPLAPRVSARHRLKRPAAPHNQNIATMFAGLRDK